MQFGGTTKQLGLPEEPCTHRGNPIDVGQSCLGQTKEKYLGVGREECWAVNTTGGQIIEEEAATKLTSVWRNAQDDGRGVHQQREE